METKLASRSSATVFSSVPNVARSLRAACCERSVPLDVIDDPALGGDGGTVDFDPARLSDDTRKRLADAEVLVSEPAVVAALLRRDVDALPNLRWCQSTYAGVDPLFDEDNGANAITPSWTLTRMAGCFGPPIAEWCVARIVEHERGFAASAADQRRREWAGSREAVTEYRCLSSLTLTVLGCGEIGRCVSRAARALGMRVVGYGRTERRDPREVDADEYTHDLSTALRAADHVVSVLPSTSETRGLLGGGALAAASRSNGGRTPVLLNVGRGDVLTESDVVDALDRGHIRAAILDVFETEPLPKESPLWGRNDVVISPHISGRTRASDVPKLFLENYARYIKGDELLHVVDWQKGY